MLKNRRVQWAAVLIMLSATAVWLGPRVWRAYAVMQIERAMHDGVYASPEDGMRALVGKTYRDITRIEIERSGTNSFDGQMPHVWFVTARVYAATRGDGRAIPEGDFDYPGSFFLRLDNGWVHVPEGAWPKLVGGAMRQFDLYGCDREVGNCN